jgi:CRP/FNR family transcriptional regulator, cyclic AMP receptor protein
MKTEVVARDEIAELIEQHALFRGLPQHHRDLLAEVAMIKDFAADEVIFREGDPANRFYLILEGEVALETPRREREPVLIQTIGADDVLGW